MIFRVLEREGTCCYEEWSKSERKMVECGIITNIKAGNKYVCREHLPYALAMDGAKADTRSKKDKEITNADFMLLVDGCTKEWLQEDLLES